MDGYSSDPPPNPQHMTSSHDHDGDDPSPNPTESAGSGGQMGGQQQQQEASYTCRRCRTELFTEGHLERHATGAQAFARRKKGDLGGSGGCTSLFLSEAAMESLPWLQAALAAAAADEEAEAGVVSGVEGKLCCPNARCRTRLGGFNWSGSQCSCGSWVVPALQVVASRVDRKGREETSGMLVVDFVAVTATAKAGGGGGGAGDAESAAGGEGEAAAGVVS